MIHVHMKRLFMKDQSFYVSSYSIQYKYYKTTLNGDVSKQVNPYIRIGTDGNSHILIFYYADIKMAVRLLVRTLGGDNLQLVHKDSSRPIYTVLGSAAFSRIVLKGLDPVPFKQGPHLCKLHLHVLRLPGVSWTSGNAIL